MYRSGKSVPIGWIEKLKLHCPNLVHMFFQFFLTLSQNDTESLVDLS